MIVRDDQRANSRARIAAAYGDRLFDSGLGSETEDMVLFQVDRRQLMFLFCSHGVKPPFQAALDVGPGKFRVLRGQGRQRRDLGLAPSALLYLPVYAMIAGATLFRAPLCDVALQAVVQGILTAIVALLLYGRMVAILGATSGAAFVALTPAMTAVLAVPVLDEWPSVTDWMAIALISLGVYLVTGGPLPTQRT